MLHFTPTSSSWLNLVERWFRELTEKALRRGVFPSVPDLVAAIDAFLEAHTRTPSHSSGRPPWRRSWRRSDAVKRFWRQCALEVQVPPAVVDGGQPLLELALPVAGGQGGELASDELRALGLRLG